MVRRELPAHRRGWLMLASFVMPIGLWCLLTYAPVFHHDNKLLITAERGDPTMATLVPGDRVAKTYFERFVAEVRESNEKIRRQRAADPDAVAPIRTNQNRLRRIEPVAEANGFLDGVDLTDRGARDRALFGVWLGLATGELESTRFDLSEENRAIIRENGQVLRHHEPGERVSTPLLNLLPQGVSASPVFLPAPHECLQAMWRDFTTQPGNDGPWMYQRLFSSLKVVFGGFLLACLLGVPLGVFCGSFDLFSRLFEPFVDFFRYMPAPTFSLLLVAAFGVEGAPKIALVFIGTFPHMVLMLANTTRLLDRNLIEAAQTLGARRGTLLGKVVVPGVVPNVYNDLRVLLGWAWTWLVIAELIGTKTGLTGFIDTQGARRNFDRVFPVIIMIGVIGFTTDQLLQIIARRLFPWAYPETNRGGLGRFWRALRRRRQTSLDPEAGSGRGI